MTTANPIQSVLEAEEKAKNIVAEAQKEAEEILHQAKHEAKELLAKREEEEKKKITAALEEAKKEAKREYAVLAEENTKDVERFVAAAQKNVDAAAKKIVEAFSRLFLQK